MCLPAQTFYLCSGIIYSIVAYFAYALGLVFVFQAFPTSHAQSQNLDIFKQNFIPLLLEMACLCTQLHRSLPGSILSMPLLSWPWNSGHHSDSWLGHPTLGTRLSLTTLLPASSYLTAGPFSCSDLIQHVFFKGTRLYFQSYKY